MVLLFSECTLLERKEPVVSRMLLTVPKIAADRLRQLREERFLSHRELAGKAGVSPTTVLSLEQGKTDPQRRTVRKLAQALEVKPQELVKE